MSILQLPHAKPEAILIDWHATLVDTHDAMYHAVDDVLPHLKELDLWDRLLDPEDSKTIEDAKLLIYVKDNQRLHPKIVSQRKISRTDIFEVLFGSDQDAKGRAHQAFDEAYKKYVDEVFPLEDDIREQLERIRAIGVKVGLISNRKRDFLEHELALVDGTGWEDLFDVVVCGSDVSKRRRQGSGHHLHLLQRRRLGPGLAGQDLPQHRQTPPPPGCGSRQHRRTHQPGPPPAGPAQTGRTRTVTEGASFKLQVSTRVRVVPANSVVSRALTGVARGQGHVIRDALYRALKLAT